MPRRQIFMDPRLFAMIIDYSILVSGEEKCNLFFVEQFIFVLHPSFTIAIGQLYYTRIREKPHCCEKQ